MENSNPKTKSRLRTWWENRKTKPQEGSQPPEKLNLVVAEAPPITEDQKQLIKRQEENLKFLYEYGFNFSFNIEHAKQRTVVGIGDMGLHVRVTCTEEAEFEDTRLGITRKEELDMDYHLSILKNEISSIGIHKVRYPNPKDPEKPIINWMVNIVYAGGKLSVNFPEDQIEVAKLLKRSIWQWRNGMTIQRSPLAQYIQQPVKP